MYSRILFPLNALSLQCSADIKQSSISTRPVTPEGSPNVSQLSKLTRSEKQNSASTDLTVTLRIIQLTL